MNDAPKHPIDPDPANELASDHSPIDPRDFRNALGSYATGVTIITVAGVPWPLTSAIRMPNWPSGRGKKS